MKDQPEESKDNVDKIHESINRLLNTKTNLKRKKKSQTLLNKQLFCDVITGISQLNALHFKLSQDGIFLESYYSISLSILESLLELFLGEDILSLIVYYLECRAGEQPVEIIYKEDDTPLIIETPEELWDLIVKMKPNIVDGK